MTSVQSPAVPISTDWYRIALLYAAGVLASFQYAKIPYMLPGLAGQIPMDLVQQAVVLSIIGAAGAVAGTFAGALCQAAGLRRTLLVGLAVGVVGALLPLAVGSYPLLLLARLLESVAHMAIVVSVPTLMLLQCSQADRPRAMTLWSGYFTLTFIVAALIAPVLLEFAGWRGFALLHAFLLTVVGVLCFRLPVRGGLVRSGMPLSAQSLINAQLRLLLQGRLLAVPITFFGYALLFVALVSVLPKMIAHQPAQASLIAMLLPCASLLGAVISLSALSHGVAGHRLVLFSAIGLVAAALCLMLAPAISLAAQGAAMFSFVLLGTLPAGIISSIPALFKDGDPDIALVNGGLVQFGNLANFVGSPILAAMLLRWGWVSVGMYLMAGALVALASFLVLRRY
jgi:MFS transporter, DHA1 family, inner membrane transport protein